MELGDGNWNARCEVVLCYKSDIIVYKVIGKKLIIKYIVCEWNTR